MHNIRFFRAETRVVAQYLISNIKDLVPKNVNLVNAYSLASAEKSFDYKPYILNTSLNLFDGFLVGKIVGILRRSKSEATTRGVDLLRSILELDTKSDLRHFFICGTSEIEIRLKSELAKRYPRVQISGFWIPSPKFNLMELNEQTLEFLKQSEPNIIWIGLGTPKQDHVSAILVRKLNCTSIGVGAALEFLSGVKRECPRMLRHLRLEWLYRLIQEPKRLWRRYSIEMFYLVKSLINNRFDEY